MCSKAGFCAHMELPRVSNVPYNIKDSFTITIPPGVYFHALWCSCFQLCLTS